MEELLCTNDFITDAVNAYSDTIYKVAFNITKNKQDAFDVCQEVFLRLVKNGNNFNDCEHLKAWLLRVAVNCAKSNCTKAYRRSTVVLNEVSGQCTENCSDRLELFDAVMRLSDKYRTVIHLYYYEDLSVAQIAEICSISETAVRSRLARGRSKLKKILSEEN